MELTQNNLQALKIVMPTKANNAITIIDPADIVLLAFIDCHDLDDVAVPQDHSPEYRLHVPDHQHSHL